MTAEPSISAGCKPPAWLSRLEKAEFRRLLERRSSAGLPVSEAETEALGDFISARSRLAAMRLMWGKANRDAQANPYPPQQRHALSVARQIDQATAKVRRMERDLHLGPDEA